MQATQRPGGQIVSIYTPSNPSVQKHHLRTRSLGMHWSEVVKQTIMGVILFYFLYFKLFELWLTTVSYFRLRPTQSVIYVPLQVNRFPESVLLIIQYRYLK